jgi:adenylate cyclase
VDGVPGVADCPAVRVGLNTGPAAARDGDWFGAAVNLAARVTSHAAGGEVLVTEATQHASGELPSVEWEPLGDHQFRNVRGSVAVVRARRRGAAPISAVIDPVCRMQVDPDRAVGRLRHGDHTYFFCSLVCSSAFAAEPEAFLT